MPDTRPSDHQASAQPAVLTSAPATGGAQPSSDRGDAVSWMHIRISLVLLAIFVVTVGAVDIAARSPRLAKWFDDRTIAQSRRLNRAFVRRGPFGDAFNGLMLEEVPRTDYAAGGVYFFGSSNLVFVAEFGNLPSQQAKFIHNFGFPAANPTQISQFIRYLEQSERFGELGREKTRVALCLTENDLLEGPNAGWFLPSALQDTGLFTYNLETGIAPVPMPRWERWMKVRHLRWYDLLQQIGRLGERVPPARVDFAAFGQEVARLVSTRPPGTTERELAALRQLLDHLTAKKVPVTLVRLPKGSWAEGSALDRAFTESVPAMCSAHDVPLLDLSHLLRDEEFMDPHHPSFVGAGRVRDELVRFALDDLRRSGALPVQAGGETK